jgi:TolB protein
MNRKTSLASFLCSTALLLLTVRTAQAQTQVDATVNQANSQAVARIAVPFPTLAPAAAPASGVAPAPITAQQVNDPFFAPLTRDIRDSGSFAIAVIPPNVAVTNDIIKAANADFLLKTNIYLEGQEFVIEARLLDRRGESQLAKRYRGEAVALSRIAHMLANDLIRVVNGKPGIFLTQIAYASNRDGGPFEIYLMDWDGANQRRITSHGALSILPSWSPDNERMVYTSFAKGTSDMYIINRRGGARVRITSGLSLNTSATFSPISNDIAFVGSIAGNPDIYIIKDDGTNLRRLTTSPSIESTPEWSPNGRQISFTSGRSGSPQIYVMDAEGTNVRRISFEGEWNDDANWAPDGERLAYTSRVNGRFQIRVANLVTGENRVLAGEGSNEQPTWSPDGRWIAFQSNRSGKWQIYRMRADGSELMPLTFVGENKDPDWSKKAE